MNYTQVLEKLERNEITPELAYKQIYKEKKIKPGKRATFIKLRINVPEEGKKVNTFLRILFLIPIPMIFARMGLRIANKYAKFDQDGLDIKDIARMLKYSKNTKIQIDAQDAQVDIKII
jgi:hypothetical protein